MQTLPVIARYLRLSRSSHASQDRPIAQCPACLTQSTRAAMKPDSDPSLRADIIVPVYNNYDDTVNLLDTICRDRAGIGTLILIDDASPDPRIAPALRAFAGHHPDTLLIENRSNLGFVGAVNAGLGHASRDVVLLNTDIELPPAAIPRILRALHAADDIATATPFSNDAYGVGVPHLNRANHRPFDATTASIDRSFQTSCVPIPIEIPRGVGFCMGISSQALRKLGPLDPAFGAGYGEETDFCLRARAAGMRNVIVTDTYVYHKGAQSFGDSWRERARAGTLRVLQRHPGYPLMVERYLAANEARAVGLVALSHLAAQVTGQPLCIIDTAARQAAPQGAPTLWIDRGNATAILQAAGERYPYAFASNALLDDILQHIRALHAKVS